jgi:DNA-binding response OmpR family regulator
MEKYRILIVDDEEDVRIFLRYNLENEGYEIHTANDGKDGLDKILSNDFDLIVTDVMMPLLNGISMFKEMQERTDKDIPVLFLTASTDELHYLSAILAGCHDFLTKPISIKLLKQKISEAIYVTRKLKAQKNDG